MNKIAGGDENVVTRAAADWIPYPGSRREQTELTSYGRLLRTEPVFIETQSGRNTIPVAGFFLNYGQLKKKE